MTLLGLSSVLSSVQILMAVGGRWGSTSVNMHTATSTPSAISNVRLFNVRCLNSRLQMRCLRSPSLRAAVSSGWSSSPTCSTSLQNVSKLNGSRPSGCMGKSSRSASACKSWARWTAKSNAALCRPTGSSSVVKTSRRQLWVFLMSVRLNRVLASQNTSPSLAFGSHSLNSLWILSSVQSPTFSMAATRSASGTCSSPAWPSAFNT
mmetsp:Transcript_17470/g.41960  ORF Transcript_17470/g.41960 Transcript_17470/m.41960 type:complete len:206 (+) Transcript_17470:1140-1757(+)